MPFLVDCSKYIKAVKYAPNETSALCAETHALFGILNSLKLVALQLEGEVSDKAIQTNRVVLAST